MELLHPVIITRFVRMLVPLGFDRCRTIFFFNLGQIDGVMNPIPDLLVETKPSSDVSGSKRPLRFGWPSRRPLRQPCLRIILSPYAYKYINDRLMISLQLPNNLRLDFEVRWKSLGWAASDAHAVNLYIARGS